MKSERGRLVARLAIAAAVALLTIGGASQTVVAGGAPVMGDVDCDGGISTRDNQALLREVLQQNPLSQTQPCTPIGDPFEIDGTGERPWGDMDCDGGISTRDNQALLRKVLQQNALSQTEPCPDIGAEIPTEEDGDEPEPGSPGVVTLTGASESGFNPVGAELAFEVTGADVSAEPGDVTVFVDGEPLVEGAVSVTGGDITPDAPLIEGRNDILLVAADTEGLLLSWEGTLWAGVERVSVPVDDGEGGPVNGAAVTAALLDDPSVSATVTSAGGQATFHNVPPEAIVVSASLGDDRTAQTVLEPESQPSGETAQPAAFGGGSLSMPRSLLSMSSVELNDIDNQPLEFLSTDDHSYFGGNTRIHGKLTIRGDPCDELTSLELEVMEGGAVAATANLAQSARTQILKPFPASGKLEITSSQLLFELPTSQAAGLAASDGRVVLRLRARTFAGFEAEYVFGGVTKLFRYKGSNRYGGRDGGVGGDDWVKAGVREVAQGYPDVIWGDFSNMNGGQFSPHRTHRTGNDIDGAFPGYNARDAATATTIISHLNNPQFGGRIRQVLVTYDRTASNPFWNAIKDVVLNDGRRAPDVIRPLDNHDTHFHWVVESPGSVAATYPPGPVRRTPGTTGPAGGSCWAGTMTATHTWNWPAGSGSSTTTFQGIWRSDLAQAVNLHPCAQPETCMAHLAVGTIRWTWESHKPGDPPCNESEQGETPAGVYVIPDDQMFIVEPDGPDHYRYWGNGGWQPIPQYQCTDPITLGRGPPEFWGLPSNPGPGSGLCQNGTWRIARAATTINGTCYSYYYPEDWLRYDWQLVRGD